MPIMAIPAMTQIAQPFRCDWIADLRQAQYTDQMNSILPKDKAWRRMLAAIRLPRFMLDIEAADHPGLLERPAVIAGNDPEALILACTPAASALGIMPGQRWADAQAACPRLGRLRARPAVYQHIAERLRQSLEELSPRLERVGWDLLYLDLSDCQSYYRYQPRHIAQLIQERLQQFDIRLGFSLGLASTMSTAYRAACLAEAPSPLIITPAEAEGWLATQALAEVFDLGLEAQAWLAELGVAHCAELTHLPPSLLSQRFGRRGYELWLAAQGRESRPSGSDDSKPPAELQLSKRFHQPCRDASILLFQLHKLCEKMAQDMGGYQGGDIYLSLRTQKCWQRLLLMADGGLPRGQAIFLAAKRKLRDHWLGEHILQLRLEAYLSAASSYDQSDIFLPLPTPPRERRKRMALA